MTRAFKFLIIEDDQDIRFLHRRALEKAFPQCEVTEAPDCAQALLSVASADFDAVISDHQLQGITGAECIRLMRARSLACPIFLVTSSDDPRVHGEALRAGATHVFPPLGGNFIEDLRGLIADR